jgi:hypothetical protein
LSEKLKKGRRKTLLPGRGQFTASKRKFGMLLQLEPEQLGTVNPDAGAMGEGVGVGVRIPVVLYGRASIPLAVLELPSGTNMIWEFGSIMALVLPFGDVIDEIVVGVNEVTTPLEL